MQVNDILRVKGSLVVTIDPEASIAELARLLTMERVGAAVVMEGDAAVRGIITERDVVRAISVHGEEALSMQVRDHMSRDPVVCAPYDAVSDLMTVMTERRIRHLPVISRERLTGIVSIGDVVKSQLEETSLEASVLRQYITAH